MRGSDWINVMLEKARNFLEVGDLNSLSEILSTLDEKKIDECDKYTYDIEGYPQSSIDKSVYYFERGCLLSAYPEREKEALESFCLHNCHQLQKLDGVELKGEKSYCSFRRANEYSYADLANDTITLVSPKLMNDPFDTLMYSWLESKTRDSEKLISKGEISENYKRILKNMDRLFSESQNFYKIRSFCAWKEDDKEPPFQNTLMWSHYADSHRGFCVVYKLSSGMRYRNDGSSYLFLSQMNYEDSPVGLSKEKEFDGETAFFTKSSDWDYEKEFRLLMYDPSKTEDYYSLKLDQGSYVYAIIFGLKCSESTRSIIRSILKGKEVLYYEMKEDFGDIYRLSLQKI